MNCTKILDVETMTMCGSDDRVQVTKDGFIACRTCRINTTNSQLMKTDASMVNADQASTIYFMLTPFGTVKIGRSIQVYERLQALHRDKFGGRMTLLATYQGTYADEAREHDRFKEWRVVDALGEQFVLSAEIQDRIDELGLDHHGEFVAAKYAKYTPARAPKTDPDYELPALTEDELNEIWTEIQAN